MDQEEDREAGKRISSLKGIFVYLYPYRLRVLVAGLAMVLTSGLMLSIGQGMRLTVDMGGGLSEEQRHLAVLVFVAGIFLLAGGTFLRNYLVSWIGERITADLRKKVYANLIRLHPGFYDETWSSEVQSRLTTDTTILQTLVGVSVSVALRNVLQFFGGLFFLFITSVKLSLIVIGSVPVILIPLLLIGRRLRRLSRDSQDEIARVGSFVSESIVNIKTVQAYNHQQRNQQMFDKHVDQAFFVAKRRILHRAFLMGSSMACVLGGIGLMLWVGSQDVDAGRISPGELAAFIFYAFMVASSVGFLSEIMGDLLRAAGAIERLLDLIAARPAITDPAPEQRRSWSGPGRGSIRVENLCYSYPSAPDVPALEGITLEIPAGCRAALVGPSGAGKSTLFDLLLRFMDADSGRILMDGIDIRHLKLADLRARTGIVPQEPAVFSGSVYENVLYGRPDAGRQEVEAACRIARVDEFIDRLPRGYDSELGERGQKLSGGQRQRLAIARAVLKDPAVLLLDEATNALDAESEHVVQQAFRQLMEGRTSLTIAHRLATVVDADCIFVLEGGRLVASGTHQELLGTSDLYRRLAELQFGHES